MTTPPPSVSHQRESSLRAIRAGLDTAGFRHSHLTDNQLNEVIGTMCFNILMQGADVYDWQQWVTEMRARLDKDGAA